MDGSKEGDETIVNHFHGVSSSSETHRDVCGQTDPGACLGSCWTGCMSNEESNSLYTCTVSDQAMELQEMGVDGQDTEKPEDPLPIAFSL